MTSMYLGIILDYNLNINVCFSGGEKLCLINRTSVKNT